MPIASGTRYHSVQVQFFWPFINYLLTYLLNSEIVIDMYMYGTYIYNGISILYIS